MSTEGGLGEVDELERIIRMLRWQLDVAEAVEAQATGLSWRVVPGSGVRVEADDRASTPVTVAFRATDADVIVLARTALRPTITATRAILDEVAVIVEGLRAGVAHPQAALLASSTLLRLATVFGHLAPTCGLTPRGG